LALLRILALLRVLALIRILALLRVLALRRILALLRRVLALIRILSLWRILTLRRGLLGINLRRRHGPIILLATLRIRFLWWGLRLSRIALIRWLRLHFVLSLLGISNLQVVVNLGHARHLAGNRLSQLLRGVGRDRPRQRDLALDGRSGNQVVFQLLGGIEGMNHIHLDLPVGTLAAACRRGLTRTLGIRVLCKGHYGTQHNHTGPQQGIQKTSFDQWPIHLYRSPLRIASLQHFFDAHMSEKTLTVYAPGSVL
jgi:hypothetical protein